VAGKGGGSWKVAYADFVTAMMAFFLVMWISGQDQKIRQAVSHYFNDPFSTSMVGTSKLATRTGSVSEKRDFGNVPLSESVAIGRGRNTYSAKQDKSPLTKLVSDWLNWEEETRTRWETAARDTLKWAALTPEVKNKEATVDQVAAARLAKELRNEFGGDIASKAKGIQQDLLYEVLSQVNWTQIAEDLLSR
jgi:chemotaxis protein MotB